MILGTYQLSKDRNLASEGYTINQSAFGTHLFTVTKPNNGGTYNVDTLNETCTCAAGRRGVKCCHVREAKAREMAAKTQVAVDAMRADREAFNKMRSADFD